ncbi:hypothetical protein FMEAI12_4600032 [Parafrankia sp. Ea1.12]|nr:hypothetical protein FMEAI12_4600032 [Parafrankia sp. Ea1.12]
MSSRPSSPDLRFCLGRPRDGPCRDRPTAATAWPAKLHADTAVVVPSRSAAVPIRRIRPSFGRLSRPTVLPRQSCYDSSACYDSSVLPRQSCVNGAIVRLHPALSDTATPPDGA